MKKLILIFALAAITTCASAYTIAKPEDKNNKPATTTEPAKKAEEEQAAGRQITRNRPAENKTDAPAVKPPTQPAPDAKDANAPKTTEVKDTSVETTTIPKMEDYTNKAKEAEDKLKEEKAKKDSKK